MNRKTQSSAEIALADYDEVFRDFAGKNLAKIFNDFVRSTSSGGACSSCGCTDWVVVQGPPNGLTGLKYYSVDTGAVEYNQFTPMVIAKCRSCGMSRMHDTGLVHHWWKGRDSKEEV